MKGDLKETFIKGDSELTRQLNSDREYLDKEGREFSLPGRSLMLIRNVGHLMTNPSITLKDGSEIHGMIIEQKPNATVIIDKSDLDEIIAFLNNSNISE